LWKQNKASVKEEVGHGERSNLVQFHILMLLHGVPTIRCKLYDGVMNIKVEFYGVVRQRTGTAKASVETATAETRLRDVLGELADRFPALRGECIVGQRLGNGYIANINGSRFVSDPDTALNDGDELMILSADAGG